MEKYLLINWNSIENICVFVDKIKSNFTKQYKKYNFLSLSLIESMIHNSNMPWDITR